MMPDIPEPIQDANGLVAERDGWHQKFKDGYQPYYLELYRDNRDSELWRSTRAMEEVCEYVLWLEKKLANICRKDHEYELSLLRLVKVIVNIAGFRNE
jgi:hypothetical protein